jgi:hypothetical protein
MTYVSSLSLTCTDCDVTYSTKGRKSGQRIEVVVHLLRPTTLHICHQSFKMFSVTQAIPAREQKEEGSIASIFTALSGEDAQVLPSRFADLKREMWKDSLIQSWREVLAELETAVHEVSIKGASVRLVCTRKTDGQFKYFDGTSP